MPPSPDIKILLNFIKTPTPKSWLDYACNHLDELLIDHAHCERKAAATALNLIGKYPNIEAIIKVMSPLAREELLHFEKVIALMKARHIAFRPQPPSTYATQLHSNLTKHGGKDRLRDYLIIGAIIEARSCERFYALNEVLKDTELKRFYATLIKAEARHFEDYLNLAYDLGQDVDERVDALISFENHLIMQPDTNFRFHSGSYINACEVMK